MVNYCYPFIFIFWLSIAFGEVLVESNIDQNTAQANFPLAGTITLTYDKNAAVDPTSFKVEGKPLEVSLVKNISLVADQRLSIYSFSWPAQEKGVHVLPSISVVINGKTYYSKPSNYTIDESTRLPPATKAKEAPVIRLEAFVKGPSTLLLGERTTLVYRLIFNQSIDLTKSELPFIHPSSFLRVGDAQVQEEQQGIWTIQEITQIIEASEIGVFSLGPSFIEGLAYQTNEWGKKYYDKQLLRAEAPAVQIIVRAFSLENQPPSFNGALGKVKTEIVMESSSQVQVGDTIKLILTISGISNITEFHLPSLDCQPGFSGRFHVQELPLAFDIKKGIKKFQLELSPLSSLIHEIPSIEISSFDPKAKKYHAAHTPALPVTILPLKYLPDADSKITQEPLSKDFLKKLFSQSALPVKIKGVQVEAKYLQTPFYQRGWVLWIFPLGIFFLIWQYFRCKKRMAQSKPKIKESERLFKQAKQMQNTPQEGLKILEKAILCYLTEQGLITQPLIEKLTPSRETEKARFFLSRLQALQYSAHQKFDYNELVQETRDLLKLFSIGF